MSDFSQLTVDFSSDALTHRRKFGGGRSQLIAKATGLKQGIFPYIVDCTAGLGKDSFVLASLGCRVQMIERSPTISALLEAGLARGKEVEAIAPIIARMSFHQGDAIAWLNDLKASGYPDIIYLDPMFPEREKSALVKKEMRLFKELVGTDPDAPLLLEAALSKALYRVVVKRPRKAEAIKGPAPTLSMEGQSSRFDIYVLQSIDKIKNP